MLAPETLTLAEAKVPRYTSYPTAPHFTPNVGAARLHRWLANVDDTHAVSVYAHVPFCKQLCWYCGCNTSIAAKYEPVHHYLETLIREIAQARRIVGRSLRAGHVHLGGGTPNALSASDFAALARALRAAFRFDGETQFDVELDPRTLDSEMVCALKAAGVGRVNLGIQDFDPKVQRAINREQPFELVAEKLAALRGAGIAHVGMDLIYGLPHQTEETLRATIDQAAELGAERVALFGYAHVPWMKPHQKLLEPEGLPDTHARWALASAAQARLADRGYARIGIDHFAYPDDEMALAQREGHLRRNFQGYTTDTSDTLLGFGPSAISAFAEGYAQNHPRLDAWRQAVEAGEIPVARGCVLDGEDRLRRAVIERLMCDLEADLDRLCRAYGTRTPAPNHFAGELARLEAMAKDDLVRVEGAVLRVPEAARPFVRVVASVFDEYLEAGHAKHSVAV
ncbi:MAG: oxygen-independent coproporphyrinogen III oxidase [Tagaea sp.]